MATGRLPDPNTAPVTAKGDLYTYSTVPAKLAVGNNGETLVADSSATTGLRYNPQNALANPVINGGFDIWQRGTSGVAGTALGSYFADRFQIARAVAGSTATRQTVSDSTNLPNIQYCARIARDSGNTSANVIYVGQSMESVNSIPYAGKTVTISFYARKGANFSSASDALSAVLLTGTGTDQSIWSGLTGSSSPISQTATLTTTWQRFAFSATLSSTLTQIGFYASYTPVGTAGANDWFEITGFQIDLGTYTASSAPAFRRSGGTLAGEFLAACRYFQRLGNGADNANENFGAAQATSTTAILGGLRYLTPMRVTPTFTISSAGHFATLGSGGNVITATALTFQQTTPRNTRYDLTVASGLVAGNAAIFLANSASATLDASAEL